MNKIQEGWLMVVEQLTMLCDDQSLSTDVVHQCEKQTRMIVEGADLLRFFGIDLVAMKRNTQTAK